MIHKLAQYYELLGLTPKASQKEIKRAYFKLAKQFHPDVNPSEEAKKKFIAINEAYEFLSDPQRVRNLLYRYASKKQQQKRTAKRNQTVKKKTKRKATVTEPEFERIVTRETLIKDIIRLSKVFAGIAILLSIMLLLGMMSSDYLETLEKESFDSDDFATAFEALFSFLGIAYVILLWLVVDDYMKFKKHND